MSTIEGVVIGVGEYPTYEVQVPDSWSSSGGTFVIKGTVPGVLGMSVWDVGEVPENPCHRRGRMDDPGPTVDDLVAALTKQELRDATEPTDVVVDGYDGVYLEWSVPADMIVTGDADFRGCDVEPSNGHRTWSAGSATARASGSAGRGPGRPALEPRRGRSAARHRRHVLAGHDRG